MKHYRWDDIPKEKVRRGITRQVISGQHAMLSLNEVDGEFDVKPHSHPEEQIVQVLAGTLEFVVGDEKIVIKTGDIVVVPSNVVHYASKVLGDGPALNLDIFAPIRKDYLK